MLIKVSVGMQVVCGVSKSEFNPRKGTKGTIKEINEGIVLVAWEAPAKGDDYNGTYWISTKKLNHVKADLLTFEQVKEREELEDAERKASQQKVEDNASIEQVYSTWELIEKAMPNLFVRSEYKTIYELRSQQDRCEKLRDVSLRNMDTLLFLDIVEIELWSNLRDLVHTEYQLYLEHATQVYINN